MAALGNRTEARTRISVSDHCWWHTLDSLPKWNEIQLIRQITLFALIRYHRKVSRRFRVSYYPLYAIVCWLVPIPDSRFFGKAKLSMRIAMKHNSRTTVVCKLNRIMWEWSKSRHKWIGKIFPTLVCVAVVALIIRFPVASSELRLAKDATAKKVQCRMGEAKRRR